MYLAGDNNLSSAVEYDLIEAKHGIDSIRNIDGNAKNGFKSVRVLSVIDTASNSTRVLEVNANSYTELNNAVNFISDKTNMADYEILEKFILWAKSHYKAKKIILQLGGHGSGARNIVNLNLDTSNKSRALCLDNSSNSAYMKSSELAKALENSQCSSEKLGLLILDLCFGSSIEEAYEYAPFSEYLLATPTKMRTSGLDYKNVIYSLSRNSSLEDSGKAIVEDFKKETAVSSGTWKVWEQTKNSNKDEVSFLYIEDVQALTFVKLSCMENVKDAIDSLSEKILDLAKDSEKCKELKTRCLTPNEAISYRGGFTYFFDLGYMAKKLSNYKTDDIFALDSAVKNVQDALFTAIIASWKDGNTANSALYYDDTGILEKRHNGLTISGALLNGKYPEFYGTDLSFGRNSKWNTVLLTMLEKEEQ